MKKFLFTLVLITSTILVFGQTYPDTRGDAADNLDLEEWESTFATFIGERPKGWTMLTGNKTGQQLSENVQSGSYAMHIESNKRTFMFLGWNDTLIGGIAAISKVAGVSFSPGEHYTERPTAIKLYAKGEMKGNDTSIIFVQLKTATTIVGEGCLLLGKDDLTSDWTQKTVNIVYQDETTKPDTLHMVISSSGEGIFNKFSLNTLTFAGQNTHIGTLTQGSYIDIDNISIDFTIAVDEKEASAISVYPNPADNYTIIENRKDSELRIYNVAGQVVLETKIKTNHETIDVSNLKSGTYILNFKDKNKTISKKLNIVR